jgi:hypothetical protein
MTRAIATAALCSLGIAAASCAPGIPDEQTILGRHTELHASSSEIPCRASVDFGDAFIERWSRRFGVAPPRVRVFLNEPLRAFTCPSSTEAPVTECTHGTDIYTRRWVHQHELIHAITFSAYGRAPQFLEEGLAVWASSIGDESGNLRLLERVDLTPIVESEAWVRAPNIGARYDSAGHFVAYLVRRFSLAQVLAVYDALELYSTAAQIDAAFTRVLGESFSSIHAAWVGSVSPERTGDESLAMLCESAPRAMVGDELSPSVCSAATQPWGVDTVRVIALDGAPFAVDGASNASAWLVGRCDERAVLHSGMQHDFLWLHAGTAAISSRGSTPLRLRRVGSTPQRCEDAPTIAMGERATMSMLTTPGAWSSAAGSRRTWLRIRHDRAARARVSFVSNAQVREQAVVVEACDGCSATATCRRRSPLEELSLDATAASTDVVRITASEQTPIALFWFEAVR